MDTYLAVKVERSPSCVLESVLVAGNRVMGTLTLWREEENNQTGYRAREKIKQEYVLQRACKGGA